MRKPLLPAWLPCLALLLAISQWATAFPANWSTSPPGLSGQSCDNATNGGLISGDETGCPDPVFDPSLIVNVQLPTGGSGNLEYLWIFTSDDPGLPVSAWTPIPGSNSPDYDPGPITETTWFRRCARREGCVDYVAESNIVVKEVECCVNFSDGGQIGEDQEACGPFLPSLIENLLSPSGGEGDTVVTWYRSSIGPPFDPATWEKVPGADNLTYQPDSVFQTTWYVRFVRRESCADSLSSNIVVLSVWPLPQLQALIQHPACAGDSNGSISVTASEGTPDYSFLWSNGSGGPTIEDLPEGTYSVTVTDQKGCTATAIYELVAPDSLTLHLQLVHPNCFGATNGSIATEVNGGIPPYVFEWDNAPDVQNPSGLAAGSYALTATDSQGCTATASAVLTEPSALVIQITTMNPDCAGGNNGRIALTVSGGTPGYTYLWNTGDDTPVLEDIPSGNYQVTVTDDQGCTRIESVTLSQPGGIMVSAETGQPTCAGEADGFITLDIQGGTPPYQVLWNTGDTGTSLTGLAAGTYSATVADDLGCTFFASYTIEDPVALALQTSSIPASCFGFSDGAATVTASGGTTPYSYIWNTNPVQSNATASGLAAGTYTVTVTDDAGCSAQASVTIGQPAQIAINVSGIDATCFGLADGSATAVVSGGQAPYTYLWSTNPTQSGPTASGLAAGTYTVTVTDDAGCSAQVSVGIAQPSELTLTFNSQSPSCINKEDGAAEVIVAGGTPGYQYLWNDPAGSSTAAITGLAAGTYSVTVTDSNSCTISGEVEVPEASEPCDCNVRIGDYVWYDFNRNGIQNLNEAGINGIPVYLAQPGPDLEYGTDDDDIIRSTVTSGFQFNTGQYLFENVCAGTYAVCFDIDTLGFQFSPPFQGGDPTKDSDALLLTGCTTPFTITSISQDDLTLDAGVHEKCVQLTDPGEIGYDEELCYPGDTPSLIVSVEDPSGGEGTLEYMWLKSDISPVYWVGNSNWVEIPGADGPEYQPEPIDKTTYYLRCARRENCWDWLESNMVTKTVINPEAIILNNYGDNLCVDKSYIWNAKTQKQGATYHWSFGPDATPSTANGPVINHVVWPTPGLKTVTLTVTIGACTATVTQTYMAEPCACKPAFLDVTAEYQEEPQAVQVSWLADSWEDDHVFLVERSRDQQQFEYIGSVHGQRDVIQAYQFMDPSPWIGESYYRVRLVDVRNNVDVSPPVRVMWRTPDLFDLEFLPNPFSSSLQLQTLEAFDHAIELHCFDGIGKLLGVHSVPPGTREMALDCRNWPEGVITVYVYIPGKRPYARKLIKTR